MDEKSYKIYQTVLYLYKNQHFLDDTYIKEDTFYPTVATYKFINNNIQINFDVHGLKVAFDVYTITEHTFINLGQKQDNKMNFYNNVLRYLKKYERMIKIKSLK